MNSFENEDRLGELSKIQREAVKQVLNELFSGTLTVAEIRDNNPQPPELQLYDERKVFVDMVCATLADTRPSVIDCNTPSVIVLDRCVNKFRKVFRKQFRSFNYLTLGRFEETKRQAIGEGNELFTQLTGIAGEEESTEVHCLQHVMEKEAVWIGKINSCIRTKSIKLLMDEIIEDLRRDVQIMFPELYKNSKQDYQLPFLREGVAALANEAHKKFSSQIPFRQDEDISVINEVSANLLSCLKLVFADVVQRNVVNSARRTQQAMIESALEDVLLKYEQDMTSFLMSEPFGNIDAIVERHHQIKAEYAPRIEQIFGNISDNAGDLQMEIAKQYEKQIYETFRKIIGIGSAHAIQVIQKQEQWLREKVADFGNDLRSRFGDTKIPTEYAVNFENGLMQVCKQMMTDINEKSLTNIQNINVLFNIPNPNDVSNTPQATG